MCAGIQIRVFVVTDRPTISVETNKQIAEHWFSIRAGNVPSAAFESLLVSNSHAGPIDFPGIWPAELVLSVIRNEPT